jgi:hypothetical protein
MRVVEAAALEETLIYWAVVQGLVRRLVKQQKRRFRFQRTERVRISWCCFRRSQRWLQGAIDRVRR